MARTKIDWSQDHFCRRCGRKMFPRSIDKNLKPAGAIRHSAHGYCDSCHRTVKRGGPITLEGAGLERYPTVAELAAQGHPCIEPAPAVRPRSSRW